MRPKNQVQSSHQIVIVGGGAGGLELTTRLGKLFGRSNKTQVTLIDENLTHVWKPLLHEIAAGVLDSNEDELNYITHAYSHHYHFQLGRMDGLDRTNNKIYLAAVLDDMGDEVVARRTLSYDTLIIVVGSVSNDFGIEGVKQHCYFLDNRWQADKFHQDFLRDCINYQIQQEPLREGQLDVVVVGGGATGVELAADLHHMITQAVSYGLDKIDPRKDFKISIIESANRILAHLPGSLSSAVTQQLKKLGVNIITDERVTKVDDKGVYTASGLFIPARMKLWAAGIKAPDFLKDIDGLEANALNQLQVKLSLQTTRDQNIFAFGDCASCPQPKSDLPVPPRAQAAHQQASLLAKSLKRYLVGKELLSYTYRDYGSLISLSRKGAIGNLMGIITGNFMIEGKLARLIYLSLYKTHQNALHGYWRVFLMSLADLLTRRIKPKLKLH